jgi:hypothetical protein
LGATMLLLGLSIVLGLFAVATTVIAIKVGHGR